MNSRAWTFWLAVLVVPLAACQGSRIHAGSTKPGLVLSPEHSAADPALAFAFFKDGTGGDIRARTENSFRTTLTDLTSGLQNNSSRSLDDAQAERAEVADRAAAPPAEPQSTAPAERLLAYRGQIRVEVARPDDAIAQFLVQVKQWGGYLQSQEGTAVTVRLPAKHFDEAFVLLRAAGRVLGETRQADDVTEEFVDLGIRLDNARKARDRLLDVLKLADKVEDILKVEVELRRLTEEIERMEGRKKFLADQVAMSSLQAVFSAVAEAPPAKRSRRPSRFGWINQIGAEWVMENF